MTDIDEVIQRVLPRELTSISDEVRAMGAPPTPILAEPYAMRLVDPDADADMISEWMNRPHLAETWEYDWPSRRWQQYLRAQLDGEYSRPFIGTFVGAPSATSNFTGRQRIPSHRATPPIPTTSGCTPRSPTSSSSIAESARSCYRASSRASSRSNPGTDRG